MTMLLIEGALSAEERALLDSCERRVDGAFNAWYDAGLALCTIRDGRLYRETHSTFDDYCVDVWNKKRNYINKLIAGAKVAALLGSIVPALPMPANEAQARALTVVSDDPTALEIVYRVAQQTAPDGNITAAHVRSVIEVFKSVTVTHALDDGSGIEIAVSDVAKAAIIEETYERMQRQKQYIQQAQGGGAKLYSDVLEVDSHGYICVGSLPPGTKVRVVIYEVAEVN